jgi:hypothetical protein
MRLLCSKLFLLCGIVALTGCSQKSQTGKAPESGGLRPESAHSAGNPSHPNAGLSFAAPSGWVTETPSSASRQAQYRLPKVDGDSEDAELVIYYFQGGGGTPQANIDRWIGQFTGPGGKPVSNAAKITHKTVDNVPLTVVDVSGAFSSSMGPMQQGGPPKPGVRMLGAIAEAGNGPWFIKLTGPERTIAKWQPSFESFLDSIKQAH